MSLTYPRDMPPAHRISSLSFTPVPQVTRAATRGGGQQAVELSPSLWRAEYQTAILTRRQAQAWEAFLDTMRGGVFTFKAYAPSRRYPLVYRGGFDGLTVASTGAAFDGTASISSIDALTNRIVLADLPAGFSLTEGDMISVAHGAGRELFRLSIDATSSAGGFIGLDDVTPVVRPDLAVGAQVTLVAPWFEAALDIASVRIDEGLSKSSLAFAAWQVRR